MNKDQLRRLLAAEMKALKSLSYEELFTKLEKVETKEFGEKEDFHQIEIQVFFDDPSEKKNLRVLVAIDDGSLRKAIFPLSNDFIMTPQGKLLGED